MTYQPENLNHWERPESWFSMDDTWAYSDKCFVFLGRNRDSDTLTESNFECALEAIGGESDTVLVIRESHWACGWIEWIAIHESDAKALREADSIVSALADYPVVDENHWSNKEYEEAQYTWENTWSLSDKIEACKDAGLSLFAARSEGIPEGDNGYIYERCLGH